MDFFRHWKNGIIPFALHWSLGKPEMDFRKAYVEKALEDIMEDSCVKFVNITDFMAKHFEDRDRMSPDYYEGKPSTEYPNFL